MADTRVCDISMSQKHKTSYAEHSFLHGGSFHVIKGNAKAHSKCSSNVSFVLKVAFNIVAVQSDVSILLLNIQLLGKW